MQERYTRNDKYGKQKADYLTNISAMDDDAFYRECYYMISQSALCNNRPRADCHWMLDACYNEAKKRYELLVAMTPKIDMRKI